MNEGIIGKNDIIVNYLDGTKRKQITPRAITVTTNYLQLDVRAEESFFGAMETWPTITTRPAFEIAFLEMKGKKLSVILMKKRRKAKDSLLTKLPGGYLPGEGEVMPNMQEKILFDTGISFKPSSLISLGEVIGHAEIHTPISLHYTFDWKRSGIPRLGVEIIKVPFESAVELAMTGRIENDSSFSAIMKLFVLLKQGKLLL